MNDLILSDYKILSGKFISKTLLFFFAFSLLINLKSVSQTSNWVSIDANGNLTYTPDANGNIIPDFSMVGYHQGEIPLPIVPVKVTLNPDSGDRHTDIQAAIDSVASLPLDGNGHRGAILLKSGYYEVSQPLNINFSGIVIRGEGKDANGTTLELTAKTQTEFLALGGSSNAIRISSTEKQITDSFVPIGAKTITVEPEHTFQTGDRVIFGLTTNDAWLALLGMDQLELTCGAGHTNWPIGQIRYKRKITEVNGNQITLDAPIVDPVDSAYNTATLFKYNWPDKIEECGVENIRLLSSF